MRSERLCDCRVVILFGVINPIGLRAGVLDDAVNTRHQFRGKSHLPGHSGHCADSSAPRASMLPTFHAWATSRDLVIVRLGITREEGAWDHARDLAPIVRAFPPRLPGT